MKRICLALFLSCAHVLCAAQGIAMYGDSTMYGSTLGSSGWVQSPDNEPATVQWLFNQSYAPGAVTVTNKGIGGTTLSNLLAGTGGYAMPWAGLLAVEPAKIVLINFGLNDSYEPGMTPTLFSAQIAQLVTIARAQGKTVILQTSTPLYDDAGHESLQWQLVNAEIWQAHHMQVPLIDAYTYVRSLAVVWQTQLSDGLMHPTGTGYQILAMYAYPIMQGVIAGMKP